MSNTNIGKYKSIRIIYDFLNSDNSFKGNVNQVLEDFGVDDETMCYFLNKTGLLKNNELNITEPTEKAQELLDENIDNLLGYSNTQVYNLHNILDNYTKRNKVTKNQSSVENTILKYLASSNRLSNYNIKEVTFNPDSMIDKNDIKNPIIGSFMGKNIELMEFNLNNLLTLSLPITPKYFYDANTQHISAFMHQFIYKFILGTEDIFFSAVANKINNGHIIALILLEIERRFYNNKSILEYMKPVFEINMIIENNYIVGRSNKKNLYVVYKCDGILIVDEKYADKVLFDSGVSLNENGILMTYKDRKPLWYKVFPIYEPKNSYNIITDSNRRK